MSKQIYLSEEDYQFLVPYIKNLDELIKADDYDELKYSIDDALIGELDDEYNSTPTSMELQAIEDRLRDYHARTFPKG